MADTKSKEIPDTNQQNEIKKEDQKYYEKLIKRFECPFTWKMKKVQNIKIEYNHHDDDEFIPLMKLMRYVVHVYVDVKNREDCQTILDKLNDCDNAIAEIKESAHPEISMEAVLFVFRSTKCFFFLRYNMENELKQLLAENKIVDSSEKKQMSTIKACKSIAWSNYRIGGTTEAIEFIREAITDNPNCDLWHFILGKLLRLKRRNEQYHSKPDAEETNNFETAYNIMKNPIFGASLAQVYREEGNTRMSKRMYERVLNDNPQSDTAILRIALGYMNLKDFANARFCLDKVANDSGKTSMYMHYRGLYHLKQHQYRDAVPFLKEAIKSRNLPAEQPYMLVMQKTDRYFDVTKHLLHMLKKYKNLSKNMLQPIMLQLAFTYFKKNKDLKESLRYFSKAIEINSDAKCLKEFVPVYICDNIERNVYTILSLEILPIIEKYPKRFDEKTSQIAKKLKRYCDKYAATEFQGIHNTLSKLKIKK